MTVQIQPTTEIPFPWGQPPVTRVYLTPRARLRRFRHRFLASALVADIKAGWQRVLLILGCLAALYVAVLVLRGVALVAYAFGVTQ